MRIAFLFAGQLRELPLHLFRKSLINLTKDLEYSIFSYCWEEEGKSLNHSRNIPDFDFIENIDDKIKFMFKDFNLVDYGYESFKNFDKNLSIEHKEIFNSKKFHFGTINSLPQIYTIYKSYKLLQKSNYKFDLVFRCRFDSIFIHPFNLFPLEEILNENILYNLNFGRAYYPNRIYDIFFGGSRKTMSFISSIWKDIPELVNNKFNNGLDKRDCCRILYLAASMKNIKVKSFSSRICDVYRNNDYLYSKYLISSHLISIRFSEIEYRCIKFIFRWFKERNLKKTKIALFLFSSFIFIPFSYLKRLIYLKIN